jgi:streptomycin 6-kinase
VTAFPIPARLAAHSADRGGWLDALPDLVAGLARQWSLQLGPPFEPGGECSWVAPAVSPGHGDVVLKVGWVHDEARDEAAGLRVWDGHGAVRLLDAFAAGETSALLLEPATPGTPLSVLDGPEQDRVLAGLLRRLWVDPGADPSFRPLHVMCDAWIEEARPELGHLDPGLVRDGLALFGDLPRDATDRVLLATDLHAENVLAARREPWLVIDPKPYVGDPAYDVVQHLLNDPVRLTADPRGFARRMAALAGVDADRVVAWLFARCVVEAAWWPYDPVPIATALRP